MKIEKLERGGYKNPSASAFRHGIRCRRRVIAIVPSLSSSSIWVEDPVLLMHGGGRGVPSAYIPRIYLRFSFCEEEKLKGVSKILK